MKLVKIPFASIEEFNSVGIIEGSIKFNGAMAEYGLKRNFDYNCYVMPSLKEIHIILADGKESFASLLLMRFAF